MNFEEFQFQARKVQNQNLPLWALREHSLFALSSKVGDILGLHRAVHEGHPMDENALRLYLGDLLCIVSELCDDYGWSMDEIAISNILKLKNMYPNSYKEKNETKGKIYKLRRVPGPESRHYARGEGHR